MLQCSTDVAKDFFDWERHLQKYVEGALSRFVGATHEEGMSSPYIIVIAGPNGVGKSTFSRWYIKSLHSCEMVIDPDTIARELTEVPMAERNIRAGRLAIQLIDSLTARRCSFAIESTLSGTTLALRLRSAAQIGYHVVIIMLWVPSVYVSSRRVAARVVTGGHDIPLDDQIRRFERSYTNFFTIYRGVCHEWSIVDGFARPPEEIANGRGGFAPE